QELLSLTSSPRQYGIVLGQAVFHDGVRDAFHEALTDAKVRLHVLLYVEAEEWKTLRWERLAAPSGGGVSTPLALNERTPLAIHLPSISSRRLERITRDDLQALIVAASPIRLPDGRLAKKDAGWKVEPFDAIQAVDGVRAALGSIPSYALT